MKPLNKLLPHLAAISLFVLLLSLVVLGGEQESGTEGETPEMEMAG